MLVINTYWYFNHLNTLILFYVEIFMYVTSLVKMDEGDERQKKCELEGFTERFVLDQVMNDKRAI